MTGFHRRWIQNQPQLNPPADAPSRISLEGGCKCVAMNVSSRALVAPAGGRRDLVKVPSGIPNNLSAAGGSLRTDSPLLARLFRRWVFTGVSCRRAEARCWV